jgi:glycosyltransferase involved in cell wall biosynthesis
VIAEERALETVLEPLVSVVVPTYNRGDLIAETLTSILAQTYPRIETIVVDDGSTDNTAEAVAPFLDRITYIRQANKGLAGARNTGIERSNGAYIAWLDSDDLFNPSKIALQVAFMERHPDCSVIASDFSAFGDDGYFEASHIRSYYSVLKRTNGGLDGFFPIAERIDTATLPHMGPDVSGEVRVYVGAVYANLVGGNCLHPPTVMFRRDAATRAGALDARFRRDVDYEFLLRLAREGQVALVDRPLMRYRYSADQMSSDKHLGDIALSRLLVLDTLTERDPALRGQSSFRRRMGYAHLAAAHALSETRRAAAARHLLQSLALGFVSGNTVRTIAKLCLPSWAVKSVRSVRRPRAPA